MAAIIPSRRDVVTATRRRLAGVIEELAGIRHALPDHVESCECSVCWPIRQAEQRLTYAAEEAKRL